MAVGKRACTAIFICQTHPSTNSRQILAAFMKIYTFAYKQLNHE